MYENKYNIFGQSFIILLIQDNQGDILLAQRLFKQLANNVQLRVIKSGTEAFQLFSSGQKILDPIPHLILLDLNLPGINGMQILRAIRQHPKYHIIPVVILTTSKRQQQIDKAYNLHVNTYFAKPTDLQEFQTLITVIKQYWSKFASRPAIK